MGKDEDILERGRYLAVGDVHGCLKSLKKLLKWVDPQKEDTVVMLGDYVDRGPDSKGVIDYLLNWKWEAKLVLLKGNHELIMDHARQSKMKKVYWKEVGGEATLESYDGKMKKVPEEHWAFIENARYFYETEDFIFVHGGVEPKRPLLDQDQEEMCWHRFRNARPHMSGKFLICGHTVQHEGLPYDKGHSVCIDTAACRGGYLTCLDPAKGKFWQVNEEGERWMGKLPRKFQKQRERV